MKLKNQDKDDSNSHDDGVGDVSRERSKEEHN